MARIIILVLLLTPTFSQAQKLDSKDFPWVETLKKSQVESIHICGDSDIQPTKKSLKKDFLVGPNKSGLLLAGIMTKDEYFAILYKENLESAKAKFGARFREVHLWQVNKSGEAQDLGSPTEIGLPFVATVKDCMEGAKTSLGNDCSIRPLEMRATCCQEKFAGPKLKWTDGDREYLLGYSPDPSVRIKVSGEKKHRYCDVQKKISI